MTLHHIQQPIGSKLCGHTCLAMALGISLEEACSRIGHRRAVRTKELVRALGEAAKSKRLTALRSRTPPDPSILRMTWPNRQGHLVLLAGGKVYDPLYSAPAPSLQEWVKFIERRHSGRLTSFLSISMLPKRT